MENLLHSIAFPIILHPLLGLLEWMEDIMCLSLVSVGNFTRLDQLLSQTKALVAVDT
jgi:hypothetical protein